MPILPPSTAYHPRPPAWTDIERKRTHSARYLLSLLNQMILAAQVGARLAGISVVYLSSSPSPGPSHRGRRRCGFSFHKVTFTQTSMTYSEVQRSAIRAIFTSLVTE